MKVERELLIITAKVLAAEDAALLPLRNWTPPNPANTAIARREFASREGVAVPYGGGEDAGRKAAERDLARAEAADLLIVSRPGGRANRVRTTPAGEQAVRSACRLAGLAKAFGVLQELPRLPYRLGGDGRTRWVSETAIVGIPYDGRTHAEYGRLEMALVPALRAAWLESNSDAAGRVSYALTRKGLARLKAPPPPADPRPRFIEAVDAAYADARAVALAQLAAIDPSVPGEIGCVPLPVSMGYPIDPKAGRTIDPANTDEDPDATCLDRDAGGLPRRPTAPVGAGQGVDS